jgi:hypothetical protein
MSTTLISAVASFCLMATSTVVHAGCNPVLTEQLVRAERIVDSLRPDKAGQMRVFAVDGSVFTAAEALWMRGQMRAVLRACAQGDDASAASILRGITDLLDAHRRA